MDGIPIYQKLYKHLAEQIKDRHWVPGDKLPSIRQLAGQFGVAKVSIQHALRELEVNGLVEAKAKSGFYVRAPNKNLTAENKTFAELPTAITLPDIFYSIMCKGAAFDISPESKAREYSQYLVTLNRQINRHMRLHPEQAAHYYGSPLGESALRERICEHFQNLSLNIQPNDICITSGCQHSLYLAIMSCCTKGDSVVIESPGFYGIILLCHQLGLKVIEVPSSLTLGVSSESLNTIFKQWKVKACILSPNFGTPAGALMPSEEKKAVVELAEKYNVTLIEDDIYGDLGFEARAEPLKAYDNTGNVILCSSFSKSISRDLRIGWIIAGKYQSEVLRNKLTSVLACSTSVQKGLADFLAEGHYKRHLSLLKQELKKNRDQLVDILRNEWRIPISYTVPEGGLCMWLCCPTEIDTSEAYSYFLKRNIFLTPGILFSPKARFRCHIRLSFLQPYVGKRREALNKIENYFYSKIKGV